MNENEEATSNRRDARSITRRDFVTNAALVGGGLAAIKVHGGRMNEEQMKVVDK